MTKKTHKIIIIEDEKPMAKALTLKFQSAGFEVKSADNGKVGLSTLKKEKFDVVLLDLIMPEMNGFKVLEQIKKMDINIPVFVVSNLSQEDDIEKASQLGATEFLIKSNVPISDVVDKVKEHLKN